MMISYLALIQALKASPDGITFKNAPTEVFKKIVALASAGCIDVTFPSQTERITIATVAKKTPTPVIERVQDDDTKRIPVIGDTAVLSHPRGLAQAKHHIIDFQNGYAVLQHPTLKRNLYRKVVWNDSAQGWVA